MKEVLTSLVFALSCLLSVSLLAQKTIPKLEIARGETYVVENRNQLFVDTLIMHDKSTIAFDPSQYGVLEAKAVYIGKRCLITSRGKNGKDGFRNNFGTDGTGGGSLTLTLNFKELDDLTIDTRGGDGGRGVNGKNGRMGSNDFTTAITTTDAAGNTVTKTVTRPGEHGTPGGNATGGGRGGNGGNLMLVYNADDFIPVFNNSNAHNSITILHTAGANGAAGIPGTGGIQSQDGVVIYKNKEPDFAQHGSITLIDVKSETSRQSN
ncbi:hypothetical protein ACFS7Z_10125 [Pontibacter toksunensis]|uniref:Collagen-like protein n=1 Tax=Pontibacter toksunensis TaxID=1332631 RepID=A0ABW6BUS4_9BACT